MHPYFSCPDQPRRPVKLERAENQPAPIDPQKEGLNKPIEVREIGPDLIHVWR